MSALIQISESLLILFSKGITTRSLFLRRSYFAHNEAVEKHYNWTVLLASDFSAPF